MTGVADRVRAKVGHLTLKLALKWSKEFLLKLTNERQTSLEATWWSTVHLLL